MHTPWGIRATPRGITWRDLWKPHKRQILVSQSPHSGILVTEHTEGSTRVREKVWPMPKICPKHSSTGGVLNPLFNSWPFAQWGLDIVGHFPKAIGNKRWLLVGTDYFIKWVEAKPLANIRDVDAKRFVWKNIITWFGISHTFISDNGLQFDSKAFKRYCCDLGITNRYSTSAYP